MGDRIFFLLNICILFSNGETKRSGVQNQTGLHDTPLKKKKQKKSMCTPVVLLGITMERDYTDCTLAAPLGCLV